MCRFLKCFAPQGVRGPPPAPLWAPVLINSLQCRSLKGTALPKACFHLWGHSINTQPSFPCSTGLCEDLCFVRLWKRQALTRTEGEGNWVGSIFWACFFLCTGRHLSDPPVPCCGPLAIFTHRDGLKRVKIMLGRRGEFIEILCLVCHGTGVFKFFLAWVWELLPERLSTRGWINLGDDVPVYWVIYVRVGIYNKILNIGFRRAW